MLAASELKLLLRYEAETGNLFWLPRAEGMFAESKRHTSAAHCASWNTKHAGKKAFTSINAGGYRSGSIRGQSFVASRVIWAIQTGEWPQSLIDHKNGDTLDDRWENLRPATRGQNSKNRRSAVGSSSRYLGVSWDAQRQKWRATIQVHGSLKCLGRFDNEEIAAAAYDAAALKHHGGFSRSNLPAPTERVGA